MILKTRSRHDTQVHSYRFVRRAIGLIALALPVVLIVGELLISGRLIDSISDYYYSGMRDVFVGSMCAIGAFQLCYRGHGPTDDVSSDIAAVAAFGLALFPATPEDPTRTDQIAGILHIAFAVVFFLTLAYFNIVLFRRTGPAPPTRRKLLRNNIYLAAGVAILVCLAFMALSIWVLDIASGPPYPVLWLQSFAILAFGVAWCVKGETILRD